MKNFRFKVLYFSIDDWREDETGFVTGKNYAEAAEKLEKRYGVNLIKIECLYEIDNDIVLLDNAIERVRKEEMKEIN